MRLCVASARGSADSFQRARCAPPASRNRWIASPSLNILFEIFRDKASRMLILSCQFWETQSPPNRDVSVARQWMPGEAARFLQAGGGDG
jgi:hypothetical protein